jgi:hypothetical protein
MEISITTPALLFPAISLIMLAYTNRFLAISTVIRSLHEKYKSDKDTPTIHGQIRNLRYRLMLIRRMQFLGVMSFLFSIICMCFIFVNQLQLAKIMFSVSILLFAASLIFSLMEILRSTNALELELSDMEDSD